MPTLDITVADPEREDYTANYEICPTKNSSYSVNGTRTDSDFRTSATITQSYRVFIPDLQFASDLTDPQVGCLPELPTVNLTPYVNSNTGYTNPYAIARSKRVTRNTTNSKMWEVTVDFSYSELIGEECDAAPPATIEDIPPIWTFELGVKEIVAYEDADGFDTTRLPTGTLFENPMMLKMPTVVITITQFEEYQDDFEVIARERSFKCNNDVFYDYTPYELMTGAVQFTEQKVLTQAGFEDAVKVVYKIAVASGEEIHDEGGIATNRDHRQVQPLIDLWYMDENGNKFESVSEGESAEPISVLLNGFGEKLEENDTTVRYIMSEIQQRVDFSTFLRDKP